MHAPRAIRPFALAATLAVPVGLALLQVPAAAQSLAPGLPPGTALVSATGDVETTLVLPILPETAAATETGFELRFQDADLDTLNVTFTVDTGRVRDTFVGVGVPGTSIFDEAYFADFLHTQCATQVVSFDASGIHAIIDCVGLENGAGDKVIDLHVELTTVGSPSPSASLVVGSPWPSVPVPSSGA